jgi:hypothetical protein
MPCTRRRPAPVAFVTGAVALTTQGRGRGGEATQACLIPPPQNSEKKSRKTT